MRRNTFPGLLAVAAIATFALAGSAGAAVLTIGSTAPVVDGEDIANLAPATGAEKLWTDTRAIGQTFTTGSQDVVLDAITLQSAAGSQPTKTYTLTIGTVSGTSYSAFATESGIVQNVASVPDDYWTFTLDTPVTLSANTLYGFDLAMNSSTTGWGSGIPYRATTADVYSGGSQFRSQLNGQSTPTIGYISGDKVFHLNLEQAGGPPPPTPVTILSTDFTGRTVSGATASNIPWVANGVADPGDLTASHPLFDTSDAQNRFAVDRNLHNEGSWSVDVPLAVQNDAISLDTVAMDVFIYNNAGALQPVQRDVDILVELLDSTSAVLDSDSVLNIYANSGAAVQPQAITLDFSGNDLDPNTNYTLRITALGQGPGNNAGFDNLNVTGTFASFIIPEPSALLIWTLGLLGLVGFAWRRKA